MAQKKSAKKPAPVPAAQAAPAAPAPSVSNPPPVNMNGNANPGGAEIMPWQPAPQNPVIYNNAQGYYAPQPFYHQADAGRPVDNSQVSFSHVNTSFQPTLEQSAPLQQATASYPDPWATQPLVPIDPNQPHGTGFHPAFASQPGHDHGHSFGTPLVQTPGEFTPLGQSMSRESSSNSRSSKRCNRKKRPEGEGDTDTPVKSKSPRTKFGAKALATMIPIFLGGNHYPTADEYAHIAATTGVNDPAAVKGWFANQRSPFKHNTQAKKQELEMKLARARADLSAGLSGYGSSSSSSVTPEMLTGPLPTVVPMVMSMSNGPIPQYQFGNQGGFSGPADFSVSNGYNAHAGPSNYATHGGYAFVDNNNGSSGYQCYNSNGTEGYNGNNVTNGYLGYVDNNGGNGYGGNNGVNVPNGYPAYNGAGYVQPPAPFTAPLVATSTLPNLPYAPAPAPTSAPPPPPAPAPDSFTPRRAPLATLAGGIGPIRRTAVDMTRRMSISNGEAANISKLTEKKSHPLGAAKAARRLSIPYHRRAQRVLSNSGSGPGPGPDPGAGADGVSAPSPSPGGRPGSLGAPEPDKLNDRRGSLPINGSVVVLNGETKLLSPFTPYQRKFNNAYARANAKTKPNSLCLSCPPSLSKHDRVTRELSPVLQPKRGKNSAAAAPAAPATAPAAVGVAHSTELNTGANLFNHSSQPQFQPDVTDTNGLVYGNVNDNAPVYGDINGDVNGYVNGYVNGNGNGNVNGYFNSQDNVNAGAGYSNSNGNGNSDGFMLASHQSVESFLGPNTPYDNPAGPGPLPNPGFSFGQSVPPAPGAYGQFNGIGAGAGPSTAYGALQYGQDENFLAMQDRSRLGSLASVNTMNSEATSDWSSGNGVGLDLMPQSMGNGSLGVLGDYDLYTRRSSAPADLVNGMGQFGLGGNNGGIPMSTTSTMSTNQNQPMRPSPLGQAQHSVSSGNISAMYDDSAAASCSPVKPDMYQQPHNTVMNPYMAAAAQGRAQAYANVNVNAGYGYPDTTTNPFINNGFVATGFLPQPPPPLPLAQPPMSDYSGMAMGYNMNPVPNPNANQFAPSFNNYGHVTRQHQQHDEVFKEEDEDAAAADADQEELDPDVKAFLEQLLADGNGKLADDGLGTVSLTDFSATPEDLTQPQQQQDPGAPRPPILQ